MYKKVLKIGDSQKEFEKVWIDPEYGWKTLEDFEADVCSLSEIEDLFFAVDEEVKNIDEGVPIKVNLLVIVRSRAYPEEIEAILVGNDVYVDLDIYDWV